MKINSVDLILEILKKESSRKIKGTHQRGLLEFTQIISIVSLVNSIHGTQKKLSLN